MLALCGSLFMTDLLAYFDCLSSLPVLRDDEVEF